MVKYAIIAAGGAGTRFGGDIPKQFSLLKNKPVLFYSLAAFYAAEPGCKIILVLPGNLFDLWADLCKRYGCAVQHDIVCGGRSRTGSVKNGIDFIVDDEALVAVHDGARPLVSLSLIQKLFKACAEVGAVVPVVDVYDSVREIRGDGSRMLERERVKLVQTPQCFLLSVLRKSFSGTGDQNFPDEASLVEYAGYKVELIKGEKKNIKITTQQDILFAEYYLDRESR